MNSQAELLVEALHELAQPATALRTALEIGLGDPTIGPSARRIFENGLSLMEDLARDLALAREIAQLQDEPQLEVCDAEALLRSCAEPMKEIAQACGVGLAFEAEAAQMNCDMARLRRALLLFLDESIACANAGESIAVRLRRAGDDLQLALSAPRSARRRALYRGLLQQAGGRWVESGGNALLVCFRQAARDAAAESRSATQPAGKESTCRT
jgi:signal transduction histidine kinase